jgi:hypothetical protein
MIGPGQARGGREADAGPHDSMLGIKLVVAWAIVGVPLAWGVWKVVLNALKLFK